MADASTFEYPYASNRVDGGVIWNLAIHPPDISEETRPANQHLSARYSAYRSRRLADAKPMVCKALTDAITVKN